jgi:hypothetical protein
MRRPMASGRPLVAGWPWVVDLGAATSGRRTAGDQQLPASRGSMPGQGQTAPLLLNFFFLLPFVNSC